VPTRQSTSTMMPTATSARTIAHRGRALGRAAGTEVALSVKENSVTGRRSSLPLL